MAATDQFDFTHVACHDCFNDLVHAGKLQDGFVLTECCHILCAQCYARGPPNSCHKCKADQITVIPLAIDDPQVAPYFYSPQYMLSMLTSSLSFRISNLEGHATFWRKRAQSMEQRYTTAQQTIDSQNHSLAELQSQYAQLSHEYESLKHKTAQPQYHQTYADSNPQKRKALSLTTAAPQFPTPEHWQNFERTISRAGSRSSSTGRAAMDKIASQFAYNPNDIPAPRSASRISRPPPTNFAPQPSALARHLESMVEEEDYTSRSQNYHHPAPQPPQERFHVPRPPDHSQFKQPSTSQRSFVPRQSQPPPPTPNHSQRQVNNMSRSASRATERSFAPMPLHPPTSTQPRPQPRPLSVKPSSTAFAAPQSRQSGSFQYTQPASRGSYSMDK